MQFNNLQKAYFIKRYKRFFIDFYFKPDENKIYTAYCPNPGRLPNLIAQNVIYVAKNTSKTAKLPFIVQLAAQNGRLLCINTLVANNIVHNLLSNKQIKQLIQYTEIKPEYKHLNSRFDFCLTDKNGSKAILEVKSVSLIRQDNLAEFPDSVTKRGQKHLNDLIIAKQNGYRSVMLYLVLINNITSFKLAEDIDKTYYNLAKKAANAGVEFLCYTCKITTESITLDKEITFNP